MDHRRLIQVRTKCLSSVVIAYVVAIGDDFFHVDVIAKSCHVRLVDGNKWYDFYNWYDMHESCNYYTLIYIINKIELFLLNAAVFFNICCNTYELYISHQTFLHPYFVSKIILSSNCFEKYIINYSFGIAYLRECLRVYVRNDVRN